MVTPRLQSGSLEPGAAPLAFFLFMQCGTLAYGMGAAHLRGGSSSHLSELNRDNQPQIGELSLW